MSAIFALAMILFFLGLDWALTRGRAPAEALAPATPAAGLRLEDLPISRGAFLSAGHTEASLERDGKVRVGLSALARKALGRMDVYLLPEVGAEVAKGDAVITTSREGRSLTFKSPVSGKVSAVNCFPTSGEYLFEVEPARLGSEIRALRVADEAFRWLKEEVVRFRDLLAEGFRASPAMATLPDGGLPADGALHHLPDESWEEFQEEFLSADD